MHSRLVFSRLWLLVSLLVLASLACNLQRRSDTLPTLIPSPSAQRPSAEILEPAEGATVNTGQTVSVRARATGASGVTLVELRVNNLVVDSQVPAEALSPTSLDVVLDYTPDQAGRISLAVIPYSNAVAGQPAVRTINVVAQGTGTTGTGTPQVRVTPIPTVYNPLCRARANTALNFRRGPGVEYERVGTFNTGQEPPIAGYADRPDGRWWQVSWGGQYVWIKESYTTPLGNCSAIRPAAVPATPTPIASATPAATQPNATAAPTLPDLVVGVLEGPRDITLGDDGTALATYVIIVRNNGTQTAGQFNVAVALPNGSIQDLGSISSLSPGQEVQIPAGGLQVTFDSPGVKRLLVTVDTSNTVAENSETNNQTYIDITVSGPQSPPTPSLPTSEPTISSSSVDVLVTSDDAAGRGDNRAAARDVP
ncbi:MAG: hypothetical protein GXY36_20145 [Chloroflexi bacterium]|nr:hypothetical protein [Chloroflexota bacterium]